MAKIWETIGISEEDYNTVLFEVVCKITESRYGYQKAQIMMEKKGFWKWMRIQREIIDSNIQNVLKNGKKQPPRIAFKHYYNALKAHFENIYFPERLENKLEERINHE